MHTRSGVSTVIFAGSVVVLVILCAAGFGLYLAGPSATRTVTQTQSDVMSSTTASEMNSIPTAIEFTPASGQMFHSGWAIVGLTESGTYALSVHAEGLEPASAGDYIVEGQQSSGSMAVVPLGANSSASEFDGGLNGVGNFFVLLNQNPLSSFENIQILFLPGMQMTNATLVATAHISMG